MTGKRQRLIDTAIERVRTREPDSIGTRSLAFEFTPLGDERQYAVAQAQAKGLVARDVVPGGDMMVIERP